MRTAVVGHVEWVEFARVEQVPARGEIVQAQETWEEPAGGGAVAAVQLQKLSGDCTFFTVLGNDDHGRRSRERLERLGVRLAVETSRSPTRRGFCYLDEDGERTITVIGQKLHPHGDSTGLPWMELTRVDGVYFCAGDVAALQAARRARVLVATARELETVRRAGVELDVLVGSGKDDDERYEPGQIDPPPRAVVTTSGSLGGWSQPGGPFRAARLPGPMSDAYGAGDSFAACLTFALADARPLEDAIAFAARCGAAAMTGRGPYEGQLTKP